MQRLPIPSGCPAVLSSLMQLCWQTDARARPTFKQILTQLDQIDLDKDVMDEIDKDFCNNKAQWELEIKQVKDPSYSERISCVVLLFDCLLEQFCEV
jgi:hypothetical protein